MGDGVAISIRRASEASPSSSSSLKRAACRGDEAEPAAASDTMSLPTQSSARSSPDDDSLLDPARPKTSSSSSTYRGGRRPSALSNDALHSFTVEELPDMLDVGYDADVEVVLPYEYDEPDSDAASNSGTADEKPPQAAGESNLTHCLQNLKLQNLMREQRARQQREPLPDGRRSTASHKRGFSESFESESNPDGTEFGASEMGSPHESKRSKRRHSDLMSSPRSPDSIEQRPESRGQRRKVPVWNSMDAMDIDEVSKT